MDIVVIGAGAIGCLLGGLLRVDGHAVSLVGRGGGGGAGTARGGAGAAPGGRAGPLRLVLPSGWKTADGFVAPPTGKADLVMVALGRHHLAGLRRGGLPLPHEAPHAVFWNVDPSEPARLGIDAERWSPGVTLLTAVRLQDGDVSLAGERPTLVVERRSGAGRALSGFPRHGIAVLDVDDALPYLDAAFVHRLLELPVMMCGGTIPWFLSFPEGRALAAGVLTEGLKTMERTGRTLARLPVGDPKELLEHMARRPRDFDRARDLPDQSWPPLLQAVLAGRQHEAREITKRAVEMASAVGLSLTWNWRLYQKAGRVTSVGFFRDPAELARAIA